MVQESTIIVQVNICQRSLPGFVSSWNGFGSGCFAQPLSGSSSKSLTSGHLRRWMGTSGVSTSEYRLSLPSKPWGMGYFQPPEWISGKTLAVSDLSPEPQSPRRESLKWTLVLVLVLVWGSAEQWLRAETLCPKGLTPNLSSALKCGWIMQWPQLQSLKFKY